MAGLTWKVKKSIGKTVAGHYIVSLNITFFDMPNQFEYTEEDTYGLETLDAISNVDNFNKWIFGMIHKYCDGKILEIGSGIGNISDFFVQNNASIYLSDIREKYIRYLKEKYNGHNNIVNIISLNIVEAAFEVKYSNYLNYFDTIFALNVIEHIENDKLAINNCKKLLKKNGKLIILVPAYQHLYNRIDIGLQHYRRYTSTTLKKIFTSNDLKINKSFYFNFMGIFAWYISGKYLKNESISKNKMRLYNKLIPVFKLIDMLIFRKAGLSVIVIGEK